MIVVSDTSAITALLQVGRVELLQKLYGEVFIPEAVRDELAQSHSSLPTFVRMCCSSTDLEARRVAQREGVPFIGLFLWRCPCSIPHHR